MKNLKTKAVFQIFILICAIFTISLAKPVSAQDEGQKACCEKTVDGNYCVYTSVLNCADDSKIAAVNCEQTSYCKPGCCYDTSTGRCHKNVARKSCYMQGGTWKEDENCDIAQCQKGCCILGSECSFVTQTRCKKEATPYEHISMIFEEDIDTESECVDTCRSFEKGCCVSADGTSRWTTRADCGEKATAANQTIGFHKDIYCSDDRLGTDCTKHHNKGCLGDEDEVYWFDSCGNPEDIAESCDYAQGSLCGQDEDGNYICRDLNCKNIYENDASPSSGGNKKHGESWCVYDAVVGFGQDVIGSRHFRHLCIAGEEFVESCKDFREELCTQGILGEDPIRVGEAFYITADYVEAACRDNRWEDCRDNFDQEDCENDFRDCYWIPAGVTEVAGSCVPHVPPGLQFWTGESKGTRTTQTNGEDICSKGNLKCEVTWERGGMPEIGPLGSREWECISNCHCLEDAWVTAAHIQCKTLGDCGAYYNVIGEFTDDGFSEDAPGSPSYKSWKAISHPTDEESLYGFSQFWEKTWFALSTAIVSGVVTWLYPGKIGLSVTGWEALGKGMWAGFRGFGAAGEETMAGIAGESFGKRSIAGKAFADIKGSAVLKGSKFKVIDGFTEKTITEKKLSEFVTYDAKEKILTINKDISSSKLEGLVEVGVDGEMVSGGKWFLQWAQTLMMIYTVYQILDWMFKDTKTETYTIKCEPWQAPTGGDDCELCRDKERAEELNINTCSEYRCKSLGQNCELINPGTDKELCIDTNPNDVNSPIITANEDVLTPDYSLDESVVRGREGFTISPDVEPFTPVTFGIKTDEPAQCKIALNHSVRYDQMSAMYMGNSLYTYLHNYTISFPSDLASEEALAVTNDGLYTFYIRCQDKAGNANERDYFARLKIKPGPDLTPPVIEVTSIDNGGYIPNGVNTTALSVYLNEPAECKWAKNDTGFEFMEKEFDCAKTTFEVSPIYYGLYECSTILTNLKDDKENVFYFRCKDQPLEADKDRVVMEESYIYTLIGTDPLYITSIGPTGELLYDNPILKIITEKGAEDGKATCGFSMEDVEVANMIEFLTTNDTAHSQPFNDLPQDTYTYYVGCVDIAGNIAYDSTTFTITADITAPKLLHVYTTDSLLHITMDEDSTCEYSTESVFDYGDGVRMTGEKATDHEATLDADLYYIICQDIYGNEMPLLRVYI